MGPACSGPLSFFFISPKVMSPYLRVQTASDHPHLGPSTLGWHGAKGHKRLTLLSLSHLAVGAEVALPTQLPFFLRS